MKAGGQVRYVGITTSEGRRHRDIEKIMASEPLDFVQVSYNVLDREVESRILPLARERGIAVIVNRPFREGDLIRQISAIRCRLGRGDRREELGATPPEVHHLAPGRDLRDTRNRRVEHVQENMGAARDPLPDAAWRAKLVAHVAKL